MTEEDDETRLRAWATYQRWQRVRVIAFLVVFAIALVAVAIAALT